MATRPNKDKRQRQNRQERAARQARSARAGEATAISRGEREAAAARAGDDTGGKGKARRGAAGDKGRGNRRRSPFAIPGQRAVVMAFLFTIVSAGTLLLAPVQVQREVDEGAAVLERIDEDDISDRDEEAGTVTYVEDVKLLDEEGPAVAAGVLLTPIIITGIAAWFTKRPQRSTAWTMALVALAGYIFFFAGPYGIITLPSLIALAVGGFQSRRVETKERLATLRAEKAARGDGEVIDVEATEAPADADGAPMADDDRR